MTLAVKLGKTPVEVNDAPGFVSNRVLMPLINEAAFAVMEGVATPEAVDQVFKLGMAHPMGPLTLADFIGLDVCVDILRCCRRDSAIPSTGRARCWCGWWMRGGWGASRGGVSTLTRSRLFYRFLRALAGAILSATESEQPGSNMRICFQALVTFALFNEWHSLVRRVESFMQSFSDTLGQVFRAIGANKLRSFLTMFGIAWGVGSLLVLVGLGEGFRSGQHRQLATLGNDLVMMWNGTIPAVANQHTGMRPYELTMGDAAAVRQLPELRAVTVELAALRPLRSEPVEQHFQPRDWSGTELPRRSLHSHGHGTLY